MTSFNTVPDLSRCSPAEQGLSSDLISSFLSKLDHEVYEIHSFMLLKGGKVVAESWWKPYTSDRKHMLYSLSKSFTSTAAGLAIEEGRFSLDDKVVSFFPGQIPDHTIDNLSSMTVRHLLTMSTGHKEEPSRDSKDWVKAFLQAPVDFTPGTHFLYNSLATYMVSAIIQKLTGKTVLEYLTPRLFQPLGIEEATWDNCPFGINAGGWGLNIKTEDIAKFGQLYLQKGVWEGKRIISEAWIDMATSAQVENGTDPNNDWNQGYGFQFWRCRHNCYRGDGAFGQYCIVMPEQDVVIAITSGTNDMNKVLNLIWDYLLPALNGKEATIGAKLPVDESLQLPMEIKMHHGTNTSPAISELHINTYLFGDNEKGYETISFEFEDDKVLFTIKQKGYEHQFAAGLNGEWHYGESSYDNPHSRAVAITGAWTDPYTFSAKLCYIETPYCPMFTFGFYGGEVRMKYMLNVSFGDLETETIVAFRV